MSNPDISHVTDLLLTLQNDICTQLQAENGQTDFAENS